MEYQATDPLIDHDGRTFHASDVLNAVFFVGGDWQDAEAALVGLGMSPEDAHFIHDDILTETEARIDAAYEAAQQEVNGDSA